MKTVLALSILFAVTIAAPEAPYPPSGWRPSGTQFNPGQQYGGPAEPATESPTTTEEPDSEPANNSSRLIIIPGRTGAQYNQGSGQFFVVAADGSVQHIAIPTPQNQQTEDEPDSEQVNNVVNSTPLGQLIRLPVSNSQIRAQTSTSSQTSGRLILSQNRKRSRSQSKTSSQYRQQEKQVSVNPEYFALTSDGRLQRLEAQPTRSEKQVAAVPNTSGAASVAEQSVILLTPEGRFQRVQVQPEQPAHKEENGQYNLLLPSGRLQRVQYMNVLSPENRLTSNVQYNEVNPINGPLYTFGSPLVRVV